MVQVNEDGTVSVAYIIGNRSEASVHVKVRWTALPGEYIGRLAFLAVCVEVCGGLDRCGVLVRVLSETERRC